MKLQKNSLSNIPKAGIDIDSLKDLPYIPLDSLPKKSFEAYQNCMEVVIVAGAETMSL